MQNDLINLGLTAEQADAVLAAYDLTAKAAPSAEMRITVETDGYNSRRHGKPWIAKVTAWDGANPDQEFGDWIGSPGDAGILEITVKAGDIVRQGQKDYRRADKSQNDWFIVAADGSMEETTKPDARKHWLATR